LGFGAGLVVCATTIMVALAKNKQINNILFMKLNLLCKITKVY
jgi:hypothetical protein